MGIAREASRALFAVALVLVAGPAAADTEVNTCGQEFKGNGFLSGDLDCGGGLGVVIRRIGTLELRGFTVTGTVRCLSEDVGLGTAERGGKCKIIGPGVIRGGTGIGIESEKLATLVDVTVTGHTEDGVAGCGVKLTNSTISGNGGTGVTLSRLCLFSFAKAVKVRDSTISNNGESGIAGVIRARVIRTMITGNGITGVGGAKVKIADSVVIDNGEYGIAANHNSWTRGGGYLAMRNAVVTGNGSADVASWRMPRVRGTLTCDTSYVLDSGGNWGICDLD